jgi:type I restriction enzyme R subunit
MVAGRLREEVAGMSLDNFIVRPKRRFVEKYAKSDAWRTLGLDEQTELVDEVAGLPSSLVDEDIAAKQFDLLILKAQLALLRAERSSKACAARFNKSPACWKRFQTCRWSRRKCR